VPDPIKIKPDEAIRLAEQADLPPFGKSFHYIFAERFGPRKMLPMSETHVRAKNLGSHGEYVLHFLHEFGKTIELPEKDLRLSAVAGTSRLLWQQVDAWLQEISPGSHLQFDLVRRADSVLTGFTFDRPGDVPTRSFRATNVGFGLSYVLPVIVALLAAPVGALVLLENPEAHMHPRGQTRLGQLAARAAAAGVQVILETHSDHVMDGVRIEVREGRVKAEKTAFHYFERDGARASVVSPLLTSDGRLDQWPPGFFDQHDDNLAQLLAPIPVPLAKA
jgi:predicted ATPase